MSSGETKVSEADIQKAVCDYARSRGMSAIRFAMQPGVPRGWPDVMILGDGGMCMFIEFKAKGRKPSKMQQHVINKLRGLRHICEVVDDVTKGRHLIDLFEERVFSSIGLADEYV